MTIFLSIIFIAVVAGYVALIFQHENELKKIFWPALIVKLFSGICVGIIYLFHYKVGDTLVFYEDAVKLADFATSNTTAYFNFLFTSEFSKEANITLSFGDERAIFMDKIVSLLCLVSFYNYWLITIYITLISFLGSWYLVKQIVKAFPDTCAPAIVAFLFFPSVTFWTSGLIKESIAMAGLYFLCGILVRVWIGDKVTVLNALFGFLSAYVLWRLKYYFAGIFFAIAAATIIYRFIPSKEREKASLAWSLALWSVVLIFLIAGVTFLHPNFHIDRLLKVLVSNYEAFVMSSKPEGIILFDNLQPTLASILINSPKALFSGLFRPLFFDANNVLAVFLSIENLALLFLLMVALRHVARIFSSRETILLCAIVVYVILLAVFITLSTPNLGTLARYRVGYLPFFVFLILLAPPIVVRLQNVINIRAKRM